CPVCKKCYHLSVINPKEWHHSKGLEFGETLKEKCYPCEKELKLYDVVEVISIPKSGCNIEVGDMGAVLMIYNEGEEGVAFEVECVLEDGSNKWLATFDRRQLQYHIKQNKNA
ncbi:DUF4926 domain-containing protein, partial [Akkermansiaceae bacterium]|nr:DUF4926 domain-containing protein [Akkermansiaceae bacterium]